MIPIDGQCVEFEQSVPCVGGGDPTSGITYDGIKKCSPRRRG